MICKHEFVKGEYEMSARVVPGVMIDTRERQTLKCKKCGKKKYERKRKVKKLRC